MVYLYKNKRSKNALNILILLLLVSCYSQKLFSQNKVDINTKVLSPAGDSFQNSDISVSWTLGNTLIVPTNLDITQNKNVDPIDPFGNFEVYPNPTKDIVLISYTSSEINTFLFYQIEVYSLNGSLVIERQMNQDLLKFNISHLPQSMYILKITDQENTTVKSFKIIKN